MTGLGVGQELAEDSNAHVITQVPFMPLDPLFGLAAVTHTLEFAWKHVYIAPYTLKHACNDKCTVLWYSTCERVDYSSTGKSLYMDTHG